MSSSIRVELGPVQETLLIPLLARARETERPRGLLRDPRAREIMCGLNYDFSKWEDGRGPDGAMLRARMFDRYGEDFLAAHPGGTVVEIGCGLDTASSGSTTAGCAGSTSICRTPSPCGDASSTTSRGAR